MNQAEFILSLMPYTGYFVDIGAYDGVSNSNTYLLEQHGWSGICFEPNPIAFKKLRENRQCACCNIAISDTNNDAEPFVLVSGYAEQISCIVKNTPQEHLDRIDYDLRDGSKTIIDVTTRMFPFAVYKQDITYLSIDAETHEMSILSGIDFDYYNITYISFEKNNYDNNDCGEFLKSVGYKFIKQIAADHFYGKS